MRADRQPCIFQRSFFFLLVCFLVSSAAKNKTKKSQSDKSNRRSFRSHLSALLLSNVLWYLFTWTFLWQIWIIWYFDFHTGRLLINVTHLSKFDYWGEGESWYLLCIVLVSLHWQPMWIIIHVTRELPASTKGFVGGGGTCTLCIDGFMESFYLFSYCILTVTQIKKIIFKGAFFPPPPQIVFEVQSAISGTFIWFLFAFHNFQAVDFPMNQTSIMLYCCMHFNFFPG